MRAEYPELPSTPPRLSVRVQGPLFDLFGWGEAISGIAQGVAAVTAAEKQASAARDAARMTTESANRSADLQDAANQRAERYAREQAESTWQNAEADRQANYKQWAAKRGQIASIGKMLGFGGGGPLPGYVASVDPRYTAAGPGAPVPVGPGQTPPTGAPAPPSVGAMLAGGAMPPPNGAALVPNGPGGPMTADPRQLAMLRARMAGNSGVITPRPFSIADTLQLGA